MKIKDLKPLKVSLHGMDERMQKMMANYLKLPCRGTAIVVSDDKEAHAEIVDVDLALSETILDERLKTSSSKPIIALSLNQISKDGVIYLRKPIQVKEVMAAFDLARNVIVGKKTLKVLQEFSNTNEQPAPLETANRAAETPALSTTDNKDVSDFIAEAIKKSQPSQERVSEPPIVTDEKNKAPLEKISQPSEIKKELTELESKPNIQQGLTTPKPEESKSPHPEKIKEPFPPRLPKEGKPEKELEKTSTKPEETVTKSTSAPPVHFLKKKKVTEKTTVNEKQNKQRNDKKQEPVKVSAAPQTKQKAVKTKTARTSSKEPSGNLFLSSFWQRKGIFLGATSLVMLIAIVHFFQQTPLYEAKARLLIGNENSRNIDLSAPPKTILEKSVIQTKIDEISSKKLIKRIISDLQLNTLPEFIKASDIPNEQMESASKIREERLAAERMSNMVDYFLQNLQVSQYKNYPIINIAYRSEKPELASKIVNRLTDMYLAIQEQKKAEKMTEIAEWENNKLPMAKNKLKQSQDALALYIEMNKWSQFEQQFAEDMGVNSEIRSLEKKVKADQALYKIMLERFEKLKNSSDGKEVKLLSSAELPVEPSYPNKPRFIFWSIIIATLFAIILTAILTVISLLKGPEKTLKKPEHTLKKAA